MGKGRAAFGGEITYITGGRNQRRAAAIVPAELVEQDEAMIDLEDGRIALERLADLKGGRTAAVPADEAGSGTRAVSAPGPYIVQYDLKALKELTKIDKPAARRIVGLA